MSEFSKSVIDSDKLFKGEHFYLIYDKYPVSPGHILIISNDDTKVDYFDLSIDEQADLSNMIVIAKSISRRLKPNGYNIGMNCGEVAGQTVMHFHCHVIPRYNGDMKDPAGGVRHCVEGKGYYTKN